MNFQKLMSKRKKRIIHQQNLAFMILVLLGTIITARGEKNFRFSGHHPHNNGFDNKKTH